MTDGHIPRGWVQIAPGPILQKSQDDWGEPSGEEETHPADKAPLPPRTLSHVIDESRVELHDAPWLVTDDRTGSLHKLISQDGIIFDVHRIHVATLPQDAAEVLVGVSMGVDGDGRPWTLGLQVLGPSLPLRFLGWIIRVARSANDDVQSESVSCVRQGAASENTANELLAFASSFLTSHRR